MASREDVKDETDQELIEWGLSIEDGLSDWEMKFLEDMQAVAKLSPLSPGRRTKLEEIIMDKG